MSSVQEPRFWKTFSMGSRKSDESKPKIVPWDPERADSIPSTTSSMKQAREHDAWLEREELRRRKYKAIGLGVLMGIFVITIAVAVTYSVVKKRHS